MLADATQLEMAILNLCTNARDAMPDGGNIVISAREETVSQGEAGSLSPGRYVRLSFRDTGSGMDGATLKYAMEPFFTTKGPGRGTGLGLSMVHGFSEQSGGRFALESRPGEGTVAELWLPAPDTAEAASNSEGHPASKEHHSLTILAVDDDGLVLANTVSMLEELGHRGIAASSGRQAIGLFENEGPVDIVITDYSMPHMTGLELAEALLKLQPDLPILLVTGYAEIKNGARLPKLSKPFTQAQLADKLRGSRLKVQARPMARDGGAALSQAGTQDRSFSPLCPPVSKIGHGPMLRDSLLLYHAEALS